MPFDNELVVVELDEKDFEGLLEYLVSRGGEPFSGMNIVVTENEKTINHTLFREIDFSKGETIKVLTSDYLANGGDKMWFFKDKIQTKVEIKLRDVIINYCKSQKVISSKLDWRILLVNTIKE
jgi:5'-nucleotidase